MSVIQETLEKLGEYLDNSPYFKDYKGLEYNFDLSLMTANNELPAFCWHVGYNDDNSELKTINAWCRSYYREVTLSLFTRTREKDILLSELWDFEEAVLSVVNTPTSWQDIHPKLVNVKYTGTTPIKGVFHQAFRDDYEEEQVANSLTVKFEFEYLL